MLWSNLCRVLIEVMLSLYTVQYIKLRDNKQCRLHIIYVANWGNDIGYSKQRVGACMHDKSPSTFLITI